MFPESVPDRVVAYPLPPKSIHQLIPRHLPPAWGGRYEIDELLYLVFRKLAWPTTALGWGGGMAEGVADLVGTEAGLGFDLLVGQTGLAEGVYVASLVSSRVASFCSSLHFVLQLCNEF